MTRSRIRLTVLSLVLLSLLAATVSAQPPRSAPGLDRSLALLNDELPGFGGMYYDEDGALTVVMVEGRKAGVSQLFGDDAKVIAGRYEFSALQGWRTALRGLLSDPSVVLLDVDEKRNRVRVGIDRNVTRAASGAVRARLAAFDVPTEAVVFEDVDPIVPMVDLTDAFNPVPGGVEINYPGFLCTLGFNVRFGGAGSTCYFMTNSHCTTTQGGVESTPYLQPAGGVNIGTEVYDPTYFSGGVCPPGRVCRYADSAAAVYNNPNACEFGSIARTTGLGSLTVDPAQPRWKIVAKLGAPTVGMLMAKTGRTTGWSEGSVIGTCVDVGVSGTNITLLCQSFVSAAVGGGDSGSPVFRRRLNSSQAQLAGLLWGGNGPGTQFVFSPMDNIELELGFALPTF